MNQDHLDEARQLMDNLDRLVPPYSTTTIQSSNDPLIQAAQWLAQGPDVQLPAASLDRIEARLRARTQDLLVLSSTKPIRPAVRRSIPYRLVWRYAAVACLILVLVVSGVTTASASSLPGEPLYPVKRAIENGRLVLATDDGEPELRVDLASRRMDEFKALLEQDTVYPLALEEAEEHLDRVLELLEQGHGNRAALSVRVSNLLDRQTALIAEAAPRATEHQRRRLESVMDESLALQDQALGLHDDSVLPSPIPTAILTVTANMTPTDTDTASPTLSLTPTSTPTPRGTNTPRPSRTPPFEIELTSTEVVPPTALPGQGNIAPTPDVSTNSVNPTRTPPGHGPTPGLGHNTPPGQGGSNPGIGNNGQPPGQQKPK